MLGFEWNNEKLLFVAYTRHLSKVVPRFCVTISKNILVLSWIEESLVPRSEHWIEITAAVT